MKPLSNVQPNFFGQTDAHAGRVIQLGGLGATIPFLARALDGFTTRCDAYLLILWVRSVWRWKRVSSWQHQRHAQTSIMAGPLAPTGGASYLHHVRRPNGDCRGGYDPARTRRRRSLAQLLMHMRLSTVVHHRPCPSSTIECSRWKLSEERILLG